MSVTLRRIDKYNWEDAIALSVREDQKQFVASNLYSIAQVQFLENFEAMSVHSGEDMVGFTLFGIDPDVGNFWIYRLMVDEKFQGKGYGYEAILQVIEEIKRKNTSNKPFIMIGYNPENNGARFTYRKAGFIETELAPWGEQLARFVL